MQNIQSNSNVVVPKIQLLTNHYPLQWHVFIRHAHHACWVFIGGRCLFEEGIYYWYKVFSTWRLNEVGIYLNGAFIRVNTVPHL